MKIKTLNLILLLALLGSVLGIDSAQAGGMPGGGKFGFGAILDTNLAVSQATSGTASSMALVLAAQSNMNWIALDLDWAAAAPEAVNPPDLSGLVSLINEAKQQKMDILLSIHNAPAWALTENGPAPEHVQNLLGQVSLVASNRVVVVELFPGANTTQAWGAPANPAAYLAVLQAGREALRANQQIGLVIPSLTPVSQVTEPGDVSAEQFLASLYQLAPNENFQVIGLHYSQIVGSPADNVQVGAGAFLRQYEMVRQVMLDNGHSSDQMWITSFAWPVTLTNEAEQAAWVEEAYRQLQGQIYIKAAFFDALFLGAKAGSTSTGSAALLQPSLKPHAALNRIRMLAAQAASPGTPAVPPVSGTGSQIQASPLARLWEFIRSIFGMP